MSMGPRIVGYQESHSARVLGTPREIAPQRYPSLREGERDYGPEAWLQQALAEAPALLLIDRIDPDARKPILLGREIGLGDRGSCDLLFVDSGGVVTLVETKLAQNSEARREVLAQVIDYAAYLTKSVRYDDLESFAFAPDQTSLGGQSEDLALKVWRESGHGAGQEGPYDEWRKKFREAVNDNLEHERIRLIIVGDEIDYRLREMVEFTMRGGRPNYQLALVEVTPYQLTSTGEEPRRVLVPSLHWCYASPIPPLAMPTGKMQWTEVSFLQQAELLNQGERGTVQMVRDIFEWMKESARTVGGAKLEYRASSPYRPSVNLYLPGYRWALVHLEGGIEHQGWVSLGKGAWENHGEAIRRFFDRLQTLEPCRHEAARLRNTENNTGMMIKAAYVGEPVTRRQYLSALSELRDALNTNGR